MNKKQAIKIVLEKIEKQHLFEKESFDKKTFNVIWMSNDEINFAKTSVDGLERVKSKYE